ncbi:MAG TPA: hypothetical protein VD928_00280 [Candidatus Paceibacterota bacterium]|nr:hypothetical protein [Candidatus Paceibacterota bacterium]
MSLFFNALAVGTALVTAVLYIYGKENSLFWYYWWYDIPMHILGGLVIGFWIAAIAAQRSFPIRKTFLLTLIAVICIGVAWEIYEYTFDLIPDVANYPLDTVADLCNDVLGAAIALLLYIWHYRRTTPTL